MKQQKLEATITNSLVCCKAASAYLNRGDERNAQDTIRRAIGLLESACKQDVQD